MAALMILAVIAGLVLPVAPVSAAHDVRTGRVGGADRYETAARSSDPWLPEGEAVVYLARGDAFPDGLAAAPLAAQAEAPLLLVAPDGVPPATRDQLDLLETQRVVLLGGVAAIGEEVAEELAADFTVERIAGTDRYDTAARVAARTADQGPIGEVDGRRSVFLASGAAFPDALAAGAAAANSTAPLPVLLTRPDQLPAVTADALADLDVEQVVVIGGDAAVDPAVTDALTDMGVHVERLAGADRQATAARVADFTIAHSDATGRRVVLARGDTFPDALAAGVYAGHSDATLLLTHAPDELGANTTEWFDSACLLIGDITAIGGNAAITDPALGRAADTVTDCHGTWGAIPGAPVADDRIGHSATWTGDRMIVWGGQPPAGLRLFDDGAARDPTEREWRQLPPAPIDDRFGHAAAWMGEELLLWGGFLSPGVAGCHADGARYDPVTGTWRTVPAAPGGPRCHPATVWTGEEFIVYGGIAQSGPPDPGEPDVVLGDAVAYDPDSDTWRTLPEPPLEPRSHAVATWTGAEVVVVGGRGGTGGAAYDPVTDEWRTISDPPPAVADAGAGIWADDALIVLGNRRDRDDPDEHLLRAAAYDPTADQWRTLPALPAAYDSATLTWADDALYVIGNPVDAPSAPGFIAYRPAADRWVTLPDPTGAPRIGHTAVWSGAELFMWGGYVAADSSEPAPPSTWRPPTGG